MNIKIHVPIYLKQLAEVFYTSNFECYLVGGAIRDLLLKRETSDFDIATNATPEAVMKLFNRVIPTGIKHGTVTVLFKKHKFEVTSFRIEGTYTDSRRPDTVTYSASIAEDLKRRDFTINGFAYNLKTDELIDLHRGLEDLKNHTIRAIGSPLDRFKEDGLRPLRACRFASQLHFLIEKETFEAIKEDQVQESIKRVSQERIRDELVKVIQSEHIVYGFELLRDSHLLSFILPELHACIGVEQREMHCFDVFYHSLFSCAAAPRHNLVIRLAALLHDVGKAKTISIGEDGIPHFFGHEKVSADLAEKITHRLKFPNAIINEIIHLIKHHMFDYQEEWKDATVRRFIARVGVEHIDNLFSLRMADTIGLCNEQKISPNLLKLKERIESIKTQDNAFTLKDLQIDGHVLMKTLTLPPGPHLGKILDFLLESVLEDPELNKPDILLNLAERFYEKRILPLEKQKFNQELS
jgi:poly(A) polymerase/tRNA nucleotidyltransferase (CCA-adding enzyme)